MARRPPNTAARSTRSPSRALVTAGNQAGGNWIYGGPNAGIGMIASGVVRNAGYNLATGVAEMSIRLKR